MSGNSKYLPLIVWLFSIFAALLGGLAATTANPIIIVLIISAFGGIFLLMQPKWTMWLVLTLGLLATGTLPLWVPSLSKLGWGVSMLGLLLFAGAAFEQITRYQNKTKTPLFIKIALIFFAYSLIISVIQWHSPGEFFTAVKRYYQVWGLMLALAWLTFNATEIKQIQRLMLWVAFAQLPFAFYELLKFVPMRKGFVGIINGIVPVDIVAGTFGGEILGGGNNAEMATFLIIIFAFLLSRWRNGLLTTRRLISYSLPILLPLFLGETKIVVVLLPVMFLGLYGNQILRRPIQGLITIGMTASLTVLAGYVYVVMIINKPLQYVINDTIGYNFEARAYSTNNLLNRTTVISFWWKKHLTDPAHMLFGHGLGSAQSGGASNIPGHIAEHYLRYGIDLTGAAQLLWETGILGFSLYTLIILTAWFLAKKLLQKTLDINLLADLAAIKAVLPIFFIYLFYRGALLETLTFQIVFFLLLGYLAFIFQHVEPAKLGNKIGISHQ